MSRTFCNPMLEGADPFVLRHGDKYYLYATNAEDGFRVYSSADFSAWEDCGLCLRAGDAIGKKWFWAPEVMEHDGKFYMAYTAEEHLAIAVSESPTGPFVQTQKKWLSEERAIDGHFFCDDDGTVYLYYVRLRDGNEIYVAELDRDLERLDEAHETFLIRAEAEWECRDCRVTEGPFVLKHGGKYYLTYSANHTRSPDYAVGCAVSRSPRGPFAKAAYNPVLHRNEVANGVGHHSFVRSSKGELICIYHRHFDLHTFRPRLVCADRAEFVPCANGVDVLVIHGPTAAPQRTV